VHTTVICDLLLTARCHSCLHSASATSCCNKAAQPTAQKESDSSDAPSGNTCTHISLKPPCSGSNIIRYAKIHAHTYTYCLLMPTANTCCCWPSANQNSWLRNPAK
jgi:hypothetical protein